MLTLIIVVAVIGLLVWVVTKYIPMAEGFKKAIYIIAIVCTVIYVLSAFGVIGDRGSFHDVPVPVLR